MNIHSTTQMMTAAAAALEAEDAETLMAIKSHCQNWLQSDDEATAQQALLDAMINAADALAQFTLDH